MTSTMVYIFSRLEYSQMPTTAESSISAHPLMACLMVDLQTTEKLYVQDIMDTIPTLRNAR